MQLSCAPVQCGRNWSASPSVAQPLYPHQHHTLADRRPGRQQGSLPSKCCLKCTEFAGFILSSKSEGRFWAQYVSCCLRPNVVQLPLFNLMLYMQLHNRCVFVKPFSLSHNYMLDRMEEKFPPHLCHMRLVCHISMVVWVWSSTTFSAHTAVCCVVWRAGSLFIVLLKFLSCKAVYWQKMSTWHSLWHSDYDWIYLIL